MNWWQFVLAYLGVTYPLIGLYLGVQWSREERALDFKLLSKIFLVSTMMFTWIFIIDHDDRAHLKPPRKTEVKTRLRAEKKRMALEESKEEAAVQLLEASVGHRQRMAALHERRKKAEEAA